MCKVSVSSDLPKPNGDILSAKSEAEVIPDRYIIRQAVVEKQLRSLNIKKAPGPDGIPKYQQSCLAQFNIQC